MKKLAILGMVPLVVVMALAVAMPALAGNGNGCATIQDGSLTYSTGHYLGGEPLKVGYDIYGYNYQAHMFNGYYANAYLGRYGFPPYQGDAEAYLEENPDFVAADHWYWPYRDVRLMMKWNDAWLSNKDCDGDGLLDRHYGYTSYIGSGAWLTNHQSESYIEDGKEHRWSYFTKIVAAPGDAELVDGTWYTSDDTEIGPAIWGAFATIQTVYNDPYHDDHGIEYLSPASAGFGFYKP